MMNVVGQYEYETQRRVIEFFRDLRWDTAILGNWRDRADNSNIEEDLLTGWLKRQGNDERIVSRTLRMRSETRRRSAVVGHSTRSISRVRMNCLRYGAKCPAGGGRAD